MLREVRVRRLPPAGLLRSRDLRGLLLGPYIISEIVEAGRKRKSVKTRRERIETAAVYSRRTGSRVLRRRSRAVTFPTERTKLIQASGQVRVPLCDVVQSRLKVVPRVVIAVVKRKTSLETTKQTVSIEELSIRWYNPLTGYWQLTIFLTGTPEGLRVADPATGIVKIASFRYFNKNIVTGCYCPLSIFSTNKNRNHAG